MYNYAFNRLADMYVQLIERNGFLNKCMQIIHF